MKGTHETETFWVLHEAVAKRVINAPVKETDSVVCRRQREKKRKKEKRKKYILHTQIDYFILRL